MRGAPRFCGRPPKHKKKGKNVRLLAGKTLAVVGDHPRHTLMREIPQVLYLVLLGSTPDNSELYEQCAMCCCSNG